MYPYRSTMPFLNILQLFVVLCSIEAAKGVVVSPLPINITAGKSVTFRWNTTGSNRISLVFWGIRSGSNVLPSPQMIKVQGSIVTFHPDLNDTAKEYLRRVHFEGDLSVGHAWFRIDKVKTEDSAEYVASIQEDGSISPIAYYAVLNVREQSAAPTATSTVTASISPSPTATQTPIKTPASVTPASVTPASVTPPSTEFPTPRPEKWVTPVIVVCVILGIPFVVFVVILFCYLCCPQCLKKCCPRCFKWFEKWCPFCPKNHGNVSGDDQGKSPEPSGEAPTKPREEDIPMREKQNLP